MRLQHPVLITALFICVCIASQSHAAEQSAWTKQFESTFSASVKVNDVSFMYPKQFELSETTLGVFLETKEVSGQISEGSTRLRDKDAATERLIKQGGSDVSESTVNEHTVYASTSIQGEQICRTYIVILKDDNTKPLYIQFRWKSENPVDYIPMLDSIVATIQ